MQRYFEGETTPEEERALARYVARTDDAAFDAVRGVLGYLSVGRGLRARRTRRVRLYSFAAAANEGSAPGHMYPAPPMHTSTTFTSDGSGNPFAASQ